MVQLQHQMGHGLKLVNLILQAHEEQYFGKELQPLVQEVMILAWLELKPHMVL